MKGVGRIRELFSRGLGWVAWPRVLWVLVGGWGGMKCLSAANDCFFSNLMAVNVLFPVFS